MWYTVAAKRYVWTAAQIGIVGCQTLFESETSGVEKEFGESNTKVRKECGTLFVEKEA
jgi:hypothetical protein